MNETLHSCANVTRTFAFALPEARGRAPAIDASLIFALSAPLLLCTFLTAIHALVLPRPLKLEWANSRSSRGRLVTGAIVAAGLAVVVMLSWDTLERAHACTEARGQTWLDLRGPVVALWAILFALHAPQWACLRLTFLWVCIDLLVAGALLGANVALRPLCQGGDCTWALFPAELVLLCVAMWHLASGTAWNRKRTMLSSQVTTTSH